MSKAIVEPTGVKRCPVCRKEFFVQWPRLWTFKRGGTRFPKYLCSYSCSRTWDRERENKGVKKQMATNNTERILLTQEQKDKAVQIALAGGSPLEYLEGLGSKAPDGVWASIKQKVEQDDPETYAKLPAKLPSRKRKVETPETPVVHTIEDATKMVNSFFLTDTLKQPEFPQKAVALKSDLDFKIRSIQTSLGTYSMDDEYFEFKSAHNKSDAIEMTIEEMIALAKELPDAMRLLGVEV